ncbi:succinyl-CoA--3-ketoacid-CoA transferase [Peribacillus butanolivorans]|uniref:Succinyl-CoA--3-ketoacid-CoA transferase n=1 Tax=Peribacillus butanolivorans TaxID=421767 RepID=A0AAX0RUS2_9BACI|nr:3-oxoacid CoA-transferase subunit B [Peribacillus butanolivorans]MCO0600783.1 3-oxoacid CoA-transferase subunit B [Peribacillus butanolivorans]PEJ23534.1 succinyl-CoA--3-ketoacid-CoA transferase [Peribacillus butanolivorans]
MSQDKRHLIAKRISEELEEGQVVNLGIGIPTLVTQYLGDQEIYLQSENGLLGIGPPPEEENLDIDLINAGKEPVTYLKGSSFFSSADSFALIRGGHVDVAILGVLQVDVHGEIANWAVPNQPILGVGGAMDLVTGAKKVIIAATLFNKNGEPKLVQNLTYKTSGIRRVDLFVSDYAVFEFTEDGVKVVEIIEDITIEVLSEKLGFELEYLSAVPMA